MNSLLIIKDPIIKKDCAVKAAGNASRLAKTLGISRSSVSGWGEYVPKTQVYRVIQAYPNIARDQQLNNQQENQCQ